MTQTRRKSTKKKKTTTTVAIAILAATTTMIMMATTTTTVGAFSSPSTPPPSSRTSAPRARLPPVHRRAASSTTSPTGRATTVSTTRAPRTASPSASALRALPAAPSVLPLPAAAAASAAATSLGRSLSALTATIAGGAFAGSLHAISGPDHLAALIPRCCGLPWHRALRVGVVWGAGHGASATMLGLAGYLFKTGVLGSHVLDGLRLPFGGGSLSSLGGMGGGGFDLLHHAGSLMELAIGVSLVVIGLLGIKEAREWHAVPSAAADEDDDDDGGDDVVRPRSLSSAAVVIDALSDPRETTRLRTPKRAVLLNGLLHGFSWDGAPSLAPAVAISTFRGSLTFLLSYAAGTMAAMALATTIIGEGTRRAAGRLDRPNLPRDLSVCSSVLAMVVGVVWCGLALR